MGRRRIPSRTCASPAWPSQIGTSGAMLPSSSRHTRATCRKGGPTRSSRRLDRVSTRQTGSGKSKSSFSRPEAVRANNAAWRKVYGGRVLCTVMRCLCDEDVCHSDHSAHESIRNDVSDDCDARAARGHGENGWRVDANGVYSSLRCNMPRCEKIRRDNRPSYLVPGDNALPRHLFLDYLEWDSK